MSLRYQINIRILILSGCILILGSIIAIWQARQAVNQEVQSSIGLAVQLITFDLTQTSKAPDSEIDWLAKFNTLKQTRHLAMQLQEPSGQIIGLSPLSRSKTPEDIPPQWFINLVRGSYPEVKRPITTLNGKQFLLIIQANPLDEITEVWEESVGFFVSLFLLTSLTFLAVNLVFNKAIKTISIIVEALHSIETGNYQQKLPDMATQEYSRIAKAINHMMDELSSTQHENRKLTLHSLTIQEEERKKLAQELHDELGQSLTAIKVMAVTIAHKSPDIKSSTDGIIKICDHLITVVRSMMRQLHPLVLSELGLKASLEDLLNQWSQRNQAIKLTLICPDEVDQLDATLIIQIFRVVQECLTNIMRHAQANEASICLRFDQAANHLYLEIADNGQGAAIERVKSGFGLLSVRERIESLGGTLVIDSQPGKGMFIKAMLPVLS